MGDRSGAAARAAWFPGGIARAIFACGLTVPDSFG